MLQVWATPVLDDTPVARLERLAGDTVIAFWDDGQDSGPASARPMLDGELAPRPYVVLAVPRRAGSNRHVVLLRWPGSAGGHFSAEVSGRAVAAARWAPATELPALDGAALMAGLDQASCRRLARGLLAHLSGIGSRAPGAAAAAAALVAALWPDRPALRPVATVTARHRLFEAKASPRLGALTETFVLSPRGIRTAQATLAPLRQPGAEGPRLRVVLPEAAEARDVVFVGATGLAACRIEPAARALPPLLAWAERPKGRAGKRVDELLPLLRPLADSAPDVAATLRELQVLTQRPAARAGIDAPSLQARIETAVADGTGLLVVGWLDDPQRLASGLALEREDAAPRRFTDRFHRFPRRLVTGHGKGGKDEAAPTKGTERLVEGFVGYLPDAPEAQHLLGHRFHLLLHSGGMIPLAAPPQPSDAAAARAAALSGLKPDAVTPDILARCLAPAVAALHRRCLTAPREAEAVTLGQPVERPEISVIVPLYRNLEFLKFQIASFAVDPDRSRCEYIYVLDSPEQRAEVEHLLRGLWRLHGLPLRLLVNPSNLGYAAANNVAAAEARGDALALVNSDVLPIAPGWATALGRRLAADPRLGAVGPKLLFEDASLQHAGMYFAQDPGGRWLNHHFHKGLPRFYAPAQVERPVPALTGACLVVRRDAYAAVGGFTEDYVIGDYEDSDLCLKLRRRGHDLRYVPAVELYHLERRSIRQHAGYMKGVACLYNSWLHAQRWQADMQALCGDGAAIVRPEIDTGVEALESDLPRTAEAIQPVEVAAA
jgi:GT2 family glycosyltransferase